MKELIEQSLQLIADAFVEAKLDSLNVAFSGGKDSQVLLDLVRMLKVPHQIYLNVTTLDPPELIRFVKRHYPEVIFRLPKETPEQLVKRKYMLPTRMCRYCCDKLKESSNTPGSIVLVGVRREESVGRRLRPSRYLHRGSIVYAPIIEWSSEDVWNYIRGRNLLYCSLYDEGWHRLGCVGCPIVGKYRKKKEFERWPHIERRWRKMANLSYDLLAKRIANGSYRGEIAKTWRSADDLWNWWVNL